MKRNLGPVILAVCVVFTEMSFAAMVETGSLPTDSQLAAFNPRSMAPASPVRPIASPSTDELAKMNQRLVKMQQEINQLKMEMQQIMGRPP